MQIRFLGMMAVVAAAYLAWRTYQAPPAAPVPLTATEPPPAAPRVPTTPSAVPVVDQAAIVLDRDANGDDRRQALFALTQAGPPALNALRQILLTPVPDEPATNAFEVSLRITALEAIDDLAERGVDVGDAFQKAAELHEDRALQTLAMAGLSGVQEGRPGKAKRFIQKMTDGSEN